MSEDEIWDFIESTRPTQSYSLLKHVENLSAVVSQMSMDDIVHFTEAFEALVKNARDYGLFLAFNLMFQGHCTDDVLADAISSLIFRGRQDYYDVVESGDRLAELEDFEVCEEASLFLDNLWEELYPGTLIPTEVSEGPYIPDWPPSREDEEMFRRALPLMFPKLYAKFGVPKPTL